MYREDTADPLGALTGFDGTDNLGEEGVSGSGVVVPRRPSLQPSDALRVAADKRNASRVERMVPLSAIESCDPTGELFVGGAAVVTKVAERTFEFKDDRAAADALDAMRCNTKGHAEQDEETQEVGDGGGNDGEKRIIKRNPLFGLVHGSVHFQASRPCKVRMAATRAVVMLPSMEALRLLPSPSSSSYSLIARPVPLPFPETSRWGDDGEDPATRKAWDPKVLQRDGMPLRFINNRVACSVVYKLCAFRDISAERARPVVGGGQKKGMDNGNFNEGKGDKDDNEDVGSFPPVLVYIRPGETAWVTVSPGVYHLRIAEGRTWFGDEYLFGPSPGGWGGSSLVEDFEEESADGGVERGEMVPAVVDEPYANYGTCKWSFPELFMYRAMNGRWIVTLDDVTPAADESEEGGVTGESNVPPRERRLSAALAVESGMGLYRSAHSSEWPDGGSSAGWEAWVEGEGGGGWRAAPTLSAQAITGDNGGGETSYNPMAASGNYRSDSLDDAMAPRSRGGDDFGGSGGVLKRKGFVLKGLTILVGSKGDFHPVREQITVNGSPVFKHDPAMQFLKDVYRLHRDGALPCPLPHASSSSSSPNGSDGGVGASEAGVATWWWSMLSAASSEAAFVATMTEAFAAQPAVKAYFHMWQASRFEVPEQRIRSVMWPTDGGSRS